MKKEIIAMLLAGGTGSRLSVLVSKRAKPALPFGAIYRIIDFTLSNIANSDIDTVGVLTQYKPLSLMEHIDGGRPWDLFGRTRTVEILPPKTGEESADWYKGTSDALFQNIAFIEDYAPELVLVVSGDHIYSMDYHRVIDYHRTRNADATVCLIPVPPRDVHHYGIAEIDGGGRVTGWIEKPQAAPSNLASMGIYVFSRPRLIETLNKAARAGEHDFARHIIPRLMEKKNVYGFTFEGYWRDVGTIPAYWQSNMDLLRADSGLALRDWQVKTNLSAKGEIGDRPSAYVGRSARITASVFARGCVIEGEVVNSVLSPGVKIGRGARVAGSIIFHDTVVDTGAVVERAIVDKQVLIRDSAVIGRPGPAQKGPAHTLAGISVIGKGAEIAAGIEIGPNAVIQPDARVRSRVNGR